MDRGFFNIISTLEKFGFKNRFPNWRCDDIATISPFKKIAERQEDEIFYWEE
jgi:hypothetical protein